MSSILRKCASAFVLAACLGAAFPAEAEIGRRPPPQERQPLVLEVRYANADVAPAEAQIQADVGALAVKRFPAPVDHISILTFGSEATLEAARQDLLADPQVLTVERPDIGYSQLTPSDPLYPQQWALPLISAPEAWDSETGDSAVLLVVVDSLRSCDHPDLAPNCRQDLARDFNPSSTTDCDHGRHVAGISAAGLDNGVAIAGIAQVSIVPARFLGGSGCSGPTSAALEAWSYALELRQQGHSVVVNNSWGGGGASTAAQDVANAMKAAGIVNIAAAGNSAADICATPVYPASYNNILTVASTNQDDSLSSFSNFGTCPGSVEVAAPGNGILSTCVGSSTCLKSGTSMAAPHVAGLAALILSQGESTVDEVVARIVEGVVPLGLPVTSGGRIDLAAPLGPPVPGIGVSLTCPKQEVNQHSYLACSVTPSGRGGYSGDVDLTCQMDHAPCMITPPTVPTGTPALLELRTSTRTPEGPGTLNVDAVSGPHTAHTQQVIEVFPFDTTTVSGTSTETKPLGRACFRCPLVQVAETQINISQNLEVLRVSGTVTVRWVFPGQIKITLIAPDGTQVVVRPSGTQGAITNWPFTIETALDGKPSAGQWTLRAELTATIATGSGSLDGWTIAIKGPPF